MIITYSILKCIILSKTSNDLKKLFFIIYLSLKGILKYFVQDLCVCARVCAHKLDRYNNLTYILTLLRQKLQFCLILIVVYRNTHAHRTQLSNLTRILKLCELREILLKVFCFLEFHEHFEKRNRNNYNMIFYV